MYYYIFKNINCINCFFYFYYFLDYFKYEKFQISEYPLVILLSVVAMFILISANDFIAYT